MARKTREGFVLYSDLVLYQLQYLPADEFKAIIVGAVKASDALANREPEPAPPALDGPALGSYFSIMRNVRESQRKYDKSALVNKMNRRKEKPKNLLPLDNEALLSLGYSVYDIAALRECDPDEIATSTNRDESSPVDTIRTEQNVSKHETEIEHNLEHDLERDPEWGFDGCGKLYSALERQGIKITPAVKIHLRKLRYSHFTEELMKKAYEPAFQDELRRLI